MDWGNWVIFRTAVSLCVHRQFLKGKSIMYSATYVRFYCCSGMEIWKKCMALKQSRDSRKIRIATVAHIISLESNVCSWLQFVFFQKTRAVLSWYRERILYFSGTCGWHMLHYEYGSNFDCEWDRRRRTRRLAFFPDVRVSGEAGHRSIGTASWKGGVLCACGHRWSALGRQTTWRSPQQFHIATSSQVCQVFAHISFASLLTQNDTCAVCESYFATYRQLYACCLPALHQVAKCTTSACRQLQNV